MNPLFPSSQSSTPISSYLTASVHRVIPASAELNTKPLLEIQANLCEEELRRLTAGLKINSKQLAHVCADPYIQDREFTKIEFLVFTFEGLDFSEAIGLFRVLIEHSPFNTVSNSPMEILLESTLLGFDASNIRKGFNQILKNLGDLENYTGQIEAIRNEWSEESPEKLQKIANDAIDQIKNLPPNGTILLPCGWAGRNPHAILLDQSSRNALYNDVVFNFQIQYCQLSI